MQMDRTYIIVQQEQVHLITVLLPVQIVALVCTVPVPAPHVTHVPRGHIVHLRVQVGVLVVAPVLTVLPRVLLLVLHHHQVRIYFLTI